jgi:hypothetical protein
MELEELDRALADNAGRRMRRDKLRRDRDDVDRRLDEARATLRDFERQVGETAATVEDLDQWSLGYIFSTFFGDRQERIADEREELVRRRLRRDAAADHVPPLETERQQLAEELGQLEDVDQERLALLDQKQALLVERGGAPAARLLESAEQVGALDELKREIGEAVEAANMAASHLAAALVDLHGARSWGVVDLIGGGLLAGMAKHANLGQARKHVHDAQLWIDRFHSELRDVQQAVPEVKVEVGSFATVADFFFDGLIADWFVQTRIANSVGSVERARHALLHAANELSAKGEQLAGQLCDLEAQRRAWLEDAS